MTEIMHNDDDTTAAVKSTRSSSLAQDKALPAGSCIHFDGQ